MKELNALRGIDIYLIDQLLKGTIRPDSKVLDAGCGSGRNIHYLIEQGIDVYGIDSSETAIFQLKANYPEIAHHFRCCSLETYQSETRFDFIICNAVLHFAENHTYFERMFSSLVNAMEPNGILFVRMTSTIGLNLEYSENGVYHLPDRSTRYLITREKVTELCDTYSLGLIEPVKTVKVEELRSMTTLVFQSIG